MTDKVGCVEPARGVGADVGEADLARAGVGEEYGMGEDADFSSVGVFKVVIRLEILDEGSDSIRVGVSSNAAEEGFLLHYPVTKHGKARFFGVGHCRARRAGRICSMGGVIKMGFCCIRSMLLFFTKVLLCGRLVNCGTKVLSLFNKKTKVRVAVSFAT